MGIMKKLVSALKPRIELFDTNFQLAPVGKLDKYEISEQEKKAMEGRKNPCRT